ncbi:hypothetical protein Ccrd_001017, partial [Cynara cardunculus var. scolymus]
GFFIALGRRTQLFLYVNNFEAVPKPIEGLIRYLVGGSVIYYLQLSSISSYQLYVGQDVAVKILRSEHLNGALEDEFSHKHSKNGSITVLIWGVLPQPKSQIFTNSSACKLKLGDLKGAFLDADFALCEMND